MEGRLYDERWGNYLNIANNTIKFDNLKFGNTYTIDLWFKLHYYPLIKENNTKNRTLLTLGNKSKIHYDNNHIYIGITSNKYPQDEWFHLCIVCGDDSYTASGGAGKLYINSRVSDSSLDLPSDFNEITIGNTVPAGWYSQNNPAYIDNMLGAVKIYGRALDTYEVGNNYMSLAQNYGLSVDVKSPYIKTGLLLDLQPNPLKVMKKNKKDNYKTMSSDLQQLTALFAQLHNELKQASPASSTNTSVKCRDVAIAGNKKPTASDLIMLSANPEYFMKMLRQPELKLDEATKKIYLSRESCSSNEISDILSNQLKANLLLSYLKQNPKNFIELINTNIMSIDQLAQLNVLLKNQQSIEAFDSEIEEDDEYNMALSMLNKYLDSKDNSGRQRRQQAHARAPAHALALAQAHVPQPQIIMLPPQQHKQASNYREMHHLRGLIKEDVRLPHVNQSMYNLATSTNKIAEMMEKDRYEREQTLAQEEQNKRERHLFKKLHQMNKDINNSNARMQKLEKLLTRQKDLVGILVNKSGQCVGAVGKGGKIHKGKSEINEPVNIIMRKNEYQLNIANILKQHQLHNLTIKELSKIAKKDKHMHLLGQCINRNHHTIAAIVRYSEENHYIPTIESNPLSNLPIVAMIDASTSDAYHQPKASATTTATATAPATAPATAAAPAPAQDQAKCTGDKCAPGFKPVVPQQLTTSWLTGMPVEPAATAGVSK